MKLLEIIQRHLATAKKENNHYMVDALIQIAKAYIGENISETMPIETINSIATTNAIHIYVEQHPEEYNNKVDAHEDYAKRGEFKNKIDISVNLLFKN